MENRYKGYSAILILALIIFSVGYVGFNLITSSGNGSSHNYALQNTTTATAGSIFQIGGVVIVLIAIVAIIGIMTYYVSTPVRYKKFSKVFDFLDITTYYAGWGLLCFIVILVPGYLLYWIIQFASAPGNTGATLEILKWIGIIIGAYFGLAAFGYIMKKVLINKWSQRRKEKKRENEIIDNMENLPKGEVV